MFPITFSEPGTKPKARVSTLAIMRLKLLAGSVGGTHAFLLGSDNLAGFEHAADGQQEVFQRGRF
jgi:hypothetical protein